MDPFVVTTAALFGLAVGSFLNVVAHRVPAGISLLRESRCPHCDAPIRAWQNVPVFGWIALRGRAACCGATISARYPLVEAVTAVAFALVAVGWTRSVDTPGAADWVVLVAFCYFAAVSIVLTLIDLDTRRLPDVIVLPSLLVAAVLFLLACALGGDWHRAVRAGLGGAALFGFYALLRFVRPDGMGRGDVKLAAVAGTYLGWIGWAALVVGGFAAFVLGSVFGAVLIAVRRGSQSSVGRTTAIAFGPWLLAGAWTGIAVGNTAWDWYSQLW